MDEGACGLDRRSALLTGVTAAGALLLPARAASGAAEPAADPATTAPGDATQFFADTDLNFQTLFVLGAAGYGAPSSARSQSP